MSKSKHYYYLKLPFYLQKEELVPREESPFNLEELDNRYYRKEEIDVFNQSHIQRLSLLEQSNANQDSTLANHEGRIIELENAAEGNMRVFNVKSFGAIGDGNADDAPAIQAALNAADLNGGGIVYVPEGTYSLSTTLIIYSNTVFWCSPNTIIRRGADTFSELIRSANMGAGGYDGIQNVTLRGGIWDHRGNVYTLGGTVISFGHCRGITVEGLTVINTREQHALELNAVQRARVLNCVFDTQVWDPVQGRPVMEAVHIDIAKDNVAYPPYGPYDNTPCDDVLVIGCVFKNWSRGVGSQNTVEGFPYTNIRIIGNHFEDTYDESIEAYYYRNSVIKGNTFKNVFDAIQLDYAEDCTVSDNTIENASSNGINVYEGTTNTVISGNVIRNTTGQGISAYSNISLSRPPISRNVIVSNILIGIGQHGINMNNASSNLVANNFIKDTAGYGILLQNSSSENTVHGNYLENCHIGGVGSADADLRLVSGSNNNSVQGNVIRSSTLEGLSLSTACSGNWLTNNDLKGKSPVYGTGNVQSNNRV